MVSNNNYSCELNVSNHFKISRVKRTIKHITNPEK